jgi:hypothetical protein
MLLSLLKSSAEEEEEEEEEEKEEDEYEEEKERKARLHNIRVEAGKKAAVTRKAHAAEQVSCLFQYFTDVIDLIN